MELNSTYLGLELTSPIVCGASPLASSLDTVRQMEDAGVSAVVLHSLFEEEIRREVETQLAMESAGGGGGFAEATMSYYPDPEGYHVGPERYLELVRSLKQAVSIPVIGSLNGSTAGGWTDYAQKIEEAGADALELNVFFLATDPEESSQQVEDRVVEVVSTVTGAVKIPVAVKLSPYFSSLSNLARRLADAGAKGLVLFNRFYQPDIDIDDLEAVPNLKLSSPDELRLRLRWLAILSAQSEISLAATGGAHSAADIIKAVMAGAHCVQLVSALLIHGPEHVARTLEAIRFWMKEHEYVSVAQMRGSMNLAKIPDPAALIRANYMQLLDSWKI